ncbi:hypothetical protein CXB51_028109 [Gossypium anomalum]|uniref:Integrase catalytic domain-containing protein n=1 Tax=Gossypium anomalum TaxID=47600 RepID=A0A8J6CKH9_9ROSI|nr:hypothetical protein CXB51_028109 [Gossypium anomalum]
MSAFKYPGGCLRSVCMDPTIDSPTGATAHASFSNSRLIHSFSRHDTVKLDESNFVQWQFQIRLIVEGYDLQGFLDGSIPIPLKVVTMPNGTLASNPDAALFTQQDRLLASAASHLFVASSVEKVAQIRHDLHAVRKGGSTVKEYVSKIKTLCALLEASGSEVSEAEKVEVLLGGLPPEFDSVFMLVSISSESLPFQKLVDVLMAFESRQTRAVHDVPMVAHVVKTPADFDLRSVRGGRSSTGARGGRATVAGGGAARVRGYQSLPCPEGGQWVWQHPPSVRDYPQPNWAGLSTGPIGAFHAPRMSAPRACAPGAYARPSRPVVGPEAQFYTPAPRPNVTDHMFGQIDQQNGLTHGSQYVSQQSPGSPVANFVGVPTAPPEAPWRTKPRARVFDVDNFQNIGLPYIPDFCASNFSDSSQFDSSHVPTQVGSSSWYPDSGASHHVCQNAADLNTTTPYSGTSELLMGNGFPTKILSVGDTVISTNSKLLQLTNVLCVPSIRKNLLSVSQFAKDNSCFLNFTRLTVAQVHNISFQASQLVPDDFTLWHNRLGHPSARIKGKSHKLPFPSSSTEYVELFELVVSDLWGPASVACEGNLYYVSFVDMSSRFTWGGEFRAFASVLAEQGIIHRLSCPHTSEQNGVAEWKHRHIVETGLTLPTPVLQGQSPYQKLYGCVPQYSHLRVFGCCCFPYLRPFVGHKLDFRSQPCKFLGYSSQHKGYFCLTPDGRVIVSRHVVFDEHQFLSLSSLSDHGDSSRQSATYIPVVQVFPSRSLNPQTPPLHVASTPSSVPDSTCAAVNSGVDSSFDTCVSPADVTASTDTDVSGAFRDSESAPLLSSEHLISGQVPCMSSRNIHAMVTRSKVGIFKPKALAAEAVDFEPSVIDEALAHPDWKVATQAEFDALLANSTWELIKRNPDGSVSRRKARLVAKGCSQVDVNNAFLNGDLDNEVFMHQPPGFVQFDSAGQPLVCRLKKALLTTEVVLYILVYVDDIIITGNDSAVIARFVDQLNAEFALKDIGDLHYFLGLEVTRSSTGCLHLCQKKYVRDLLVRSSLSNAKPVHTPMISSPRLSKNDGDLLSDPTEYRSLVGALQYVVLTRPDIPYAINRICQFMHSPTTLYMVALKCILRYLCGTLDYGIVFRPSSRLALVGYADAN